jgi:hypothetical protein
MNDGGESVPPSSHGRVRRDATRRDAKCHEIISHHVITSFIFIHRANNLFQTRKNEMKNRMDLMRVDTRRRAVTERPRGKAREDVDAGARNVRDVARGRCARLRVRLLRKTRGDGVERSNDSNL